MSPDFETRKEFVHFTVAKEDQRAFLSVPLQADLGLEADYRDDWEYAIRYRQMIQVSLTRPERLEAVHRRALAGIMARARRHQLPLASAERHEVASWLHEPDGELDLDETLEAWEGVLPMDAEALRVSFRREVPRRVILAADTSISMAGERFAMTLVGLGALALNLRAQDYAVVAFDYRPRVIKRFSETMSAAAAVSKLMQTPPQGMTDLAGALTAMHRLAEGGDRRRTVSVLLTDGQQTAGDNPLGVAPRLKPLLVVPLNAHPETLLSAGDLAKAGGGALLPIERPADIPGRLAAVAAQVRRAR